MGARHRVGIGLSYRPARLHRLAEFIRWNRFLGSINVFKNTGSHTTTDLAMGRSYLIKETQPQNIWLIFEREPAVFKTVVYVPLEPPP